MKKALLLIVLLLTGSHFYAQDYNFEKKELKKQLKTELKKELNSRDTSKIKEIRKKLSHVEIKENSNFIDTTKIIVYNFENKKYTKSNVTPIVGEPLVFKIENINRLAYDVTIKSKDIAIVDEYFDDEIKTAIRHTNDVTAKLLPIEEKNINHPRITSTEAPINQDSTYNLNLQQWNDKIIEINKDISDIKIDIIKEENKIDEKLESIKNDSIDFIKSNNEILLKQISNNKLELLKAKNEIKIKKINILEHQIEIKKLEGKINTLEGKSRTITKTFYVLKEHYTTILNQYLVLKNIETEYQNFKQLALNPLLNHQTYLKKADEDTFFIKKLNDYNGSVKRFNELVNSFNNDFYAAMHDLPNTFNDIDYIRYTFQQIKDEVDKIKNNADVLDLNTKILKVKAIDAVLRNPKAYEILSAPIQPFEDYVTFDVNLKHRDSNKLSEYDDNREFTYMEYTRGGVRFDFSTGVVFNFGGNNTDYEIKNTTIIENNIEVDKKEIVLTNKNDYTPMLAGMFHTSFRNNGILSFGLTLGASINVETFELNSLFPGVSILIGKKQKLIITGGPAFRQVNVLKNRYKDKTYYDIDELTEVSNEDLTAKQFKIGAFVGITYNLTQKQRGKFKIN
ncbi:hypothetical protein [Flavobacterium sp. J27]|uniref:hypothetical protein n=1 Tax=Flavobacterium sp. J27 TaxID=2060419 RepID=UPI0010310C0B|nr:hypothetical protein [Flavobacterium sp. J27]